MDNDNVLFQRAKRIAEYSTYGLPGGFDIKFIDYPAIIRPFDPKLNREITEEGKKLIRRYSMWADSFMHPYEITDNRVMY